MSDRLPPVAAVGVALGLALAQTAAAEPGAPPGYEVAHRGTAHDALFELRMQGGRGFAVGDHGLLLISDDDGETWQTRTVPSEAALLGLDVTAGGRGLIVGQAGLILRTDDHGARWSRVDTGRSERLFAVGLDPGGFALAVGAFGTLLASSDHGQSWRDAAPDWERLLASGEAPHLYDVRVLDQGVALVVGEFGLILRRDDAAGRWSLIRQGERALFAIREAGDVGIFAMGQRGLLLRSSDDGLSWQPRDPGAGFDLLDLALRADGRGLLAGMHDLLLTADGGETWAAMSGAPLPLPWHQPLARTAAGDFLIAGGHGAIVRIPGEVPP